MNSDEYNAGYPSRPSSPMLVATQVDYKPKSTPPPYIPSSSPSTASTSPEPENYKLDRPHRSPSTSTGDRQKSRKSKKRRKQRTRPSQGDTVLISYLEPNRPDIAQEVGQRALNSASQSEVDDESDSARRKGKIHDNGDAGVRSQLGKHPAERGGKFSPPQTLDTEAGTRLEPIIPPAMPSIYPDTNGHVEGRWSANKTGTSAFSPLPLDPSLQTRLAPVPFHQRTEDDTLATSPNLAKFAIPAAEANADTTLPAMQKSPPRSSLGHSPEGTQTLPSLQTALNQPVLSQYDNHFVETPSGISPFSHNSGLSPAVSRSQFSGPSPSLFSQPSPASSKDLPGVTSPDQTTQHHYWRVSPKDTNLLTVNSPAASTLTPAPPPYPTPKDNPSPEDNNTDPPPSSNPQEPDGSAPNGSSTSNNYKCTYANCSAAPFHTQYLLNSHLNVHSSDRPHYCPVKNCSRGVGGKGFKRKNEMIRHGLVHNSPGYVCPYCIDQQHKYPRPDNLQR